ncbi:hypothetical protein POPTR_001G165120v4 [Populus trichocarpa]|uniref:Uncharacterized protein n=1 Tax=Populus trichocarpa TaxID=3694 RepID=A0ACC0TJE1_POPTR|nr:hypothetical protein POPTR_001G165120v4 [Populus trichocarpa]
MSFFIVVIVHLSSSNLLGGFLFFTICCRHTIPISVELSLAATPLFSCVTQVTGCKKLKHHLFPVSLKL